MGVMEELSMGKISFLLILWFFSRFFILLAFGIIIPEYIELLFYSIVMILNYIIYNFNLLFRTCDYVFE